jgi:hypothetical protein
MWTCAKCGEVIEDQFDTCWKCSTSRSAAAAPTETAETSEGKPAWRMSYKVFRGTFATWESLFSEAAEFATSVGPERVISISHSEDDDDGVVTVWYWTDETEAVGGERGPA